MPQFTTTIKLTFLIPHYTYKKTISAALGHISQQTACQKRQRKKVGSTGPTRIPDETAEVFIPLQADNLVHKHKYQPVNFFMPHRAYVQCVTPYSTKQKKSSTTPS